MAETYLKRNHNDGCYNSQDFPEADPEFYGTLLCKRRIKWASKKCFLYSMVSSNKRRKFLISIFVRYFLRNFVSV